MRTIVCDTGPILHLGEAKLLKLLQKVRKIYIPEVVDDELYVLKNGWYSKWLSQRIINKAYEALDQIFMKKQ